jgi:hypothetical protein
MFVKSFCRYNVVAFENAFNNPEFHFNGFYEKSKHFLFEFSKMFANYNVATAFTCDQPSLKWLVANFVCCSPMQPRLVANFVCCSPMQPGCVENIACFTGT